MYTGPILTYQISNKKINEEYIIIVPMGWFNLELRLVLRNVLSIIRVTCMHWYLHLVSCRHPATPVCEKRQYVSDPGRYTSVLLPSLCFRESWERELESSDSSPQPSSNHATSTSKAVCVCMCVCVVIPQAYFQFFVCCSWDNFSACTS